MAWYELLVTFLIFAGEGLIFAGYSAAEVGVQALNLVVIVVAIGVLNERFSATRMQPGLQIGERSGMMVPRGHPKRIAEYALTVAWLTPPRPSFRSLRHEEVSTSAHLRQGDYHSRTKKESSDKNDTVKQY